MVFQGLVVFLKVTHKLYKINFLMAFWKLRDKIMEEEEVKFADYVGVMIDEATDNYDKIQMVIVVRHELRG